MPKKNSASERALMPVSRVARALEVSETSVRRLVHEGRLACIRDADGRRLFDPDVVDAFKRQRAAA